MSLSKKQIHFPFDFDQWYDLVKNIMENCVIIPITQYDAISMTNFYKEFCLNKKNMLTRENKSNLKLICSELAKYINKEKYYFVRMSNRSCKDGISLITDYDEINNIIKSDVYSNDKLIQICDLQINNLKCSNVEQIINLLLTSERVYTDLLLALDCDVLITDDKNWKTSIILREWIDYQMEFRIFIFKNHIVGISQYNCHCCYKNFILDDDGLISYVKNIIIPRITILDTYVLDIGLYKNDQYHIIELNPYHPTTGACLFDWIDDRNILFGVSDYPIVRMKLQEDLDEDINKVLEVVVSEYDYNRDKFKKSVYEYLC